MTDHVAIKVPDFKDAFAFSSWARTLDDKQVQAWTTDDWLAVYEKLAAYTDNNAAYDKYFRQSCKEVDGKKGEEFLATASEYDIRARKRKFFVSREENLTAFVKLYYNYRFEPQQHAAIIALGEDCGQALAARDDVDAAAISSIREDVREPETGLTDDLLHTAQKIDDIVLQQTNLYQLQNGEKIIDTAGHEVPFYEGWKKFASDILIDKKYGRGNGVTSNDDVDYSEITLGLPKEDDFIEVAFHESAHAHLQNRTVCQKQLVGLGAALTTAYGSKLDVKFNKLLAYNNDFYFSANHVSPYMMLQYEYFPRMSYKEERQHENRAFKTYQKQPIERFSRLFSQTAERTFRHAKAQISERNALMVAGYLRRLAGLPEQAHYENNAIVLKYRSPLYKPAELFERINFAFAGAGAEMQEKLNIRREGDDVVLNVPTDYRLKKQFTEFSDKNFNNMSLLAHVRRQAAQKADKVLEKISGGKIKRKIADIELPEFMKITEDGISMVVEKAERDVRKTRHTQNMVQKKLKDTLKRAIFGRSDRRA